MISCFHEVCGAVRCYLFLPVSCHILVTSCFDASECITHDSFMCVCVEDELFMTASQDVTIKNVVCLTLIHCVFTRCASTEHQEESMCIVL